MSSKKRHVGLLSVEKQASKKGRHVENIKICDRISALPDNVLCHILSFLPTKYAVGTSILSTRWMNLFVSVPVLDFEDSLSKISPPYRKKYGTPARVTNISFSNFVSRVLSLHKVMCIPKFRLKCVKYHYEHSDICSWISAATSRNVQELEVATRLMLRGPMPRELFDYKSLVVLKLRGEFDMALSGSVCLPLLKTLHLINVALRNRDSTWSILSHFPFLEDLLLKSFVAHDKTVDISVPSLKRLELIDLRGFKCIVLNGLALDHFIYKSSAAVGYSVTRFDSLINAHIGIEIGSGTEVSDEFPDFVNMLQNVKFLSLSAETLQAIQDSNCSLPTFHNLIRLEFTDSINSGWQPISDLLDSSPQLEFLVFGDDLPLISEHEDEYEYGSDAEEEASLPIAEHLCLSLHMKEIEIKKCTGHGDGITICKYFLEKAKVLSKLIVHSLGELETHFQTSQSLLAFPRSSTTCQVVLIEEYELR